MKQQATVLTILVAIVASIAWSLREPRGTEEAAASGGVAPQPATSAEGEQDLEAPARRAVIAEARERSETSAASAAPTPPPAAENEALPASGIEVIVLLGDQVAHEGWVHLLRTRSLPSDPWTQDIETRHLALDATGKVHAAGLSAGDWHVGAQLPGSQPHWKRTLYDPEVPQRIMIVLGTARLYGTVFGPEGKPLEGARVTVSGVRQRVRASAWTDARGDYALENLTSATSWLTLDSGDTVRDEMSQIQLAEGESRRRDFGRAGGLPVWSGVVRSAEGAPSPNYAGPGRSGKVHLKRMGDGAYSAHRFEDDGSFSIALEPGPYEVSVNAASRTFRWQRAEPVVVPATGLQLDLAIGGARVTGMVRAPAHEAAVPNVQVELVRVGAGAEYNVETDDEGRYAIDGVVPGSYTLRTWPRASQASGEITVRENDAAIERDLLIQR